jgi:ParB family transcriptional regulator, chromosome partitioning protein
VGTAQKSRGGRVDFSTLVSSVGDRSTVDASTPIDGQFRENVPLADLTPNPRNPRSTVGDLSDLRTIADRQLQPGTVVTRARWLGLWPEDSEAIGDAKWIVVNGCRRLAASREYGRKGMDVVVRDGLAASRESVLWASIVENIDRRDFDVVEEAEAVELLVTELGSATRAAEKLGRSEGWISQRRALLKLTPELREKLRTGELAVRDARQLAQIPTAEQVAAWSASQDVPVSEGPEVRRPRPPSKRDRDNSKSAVRAIHKIRSDPTAIAAVLKEALDDGQIEKLLKELQGL